MTPLQLLGLLCIFAVARVAVGRRVPAAGVSTARAVRDYLDALIVAGLVALFLATFILRTYYIPSISMIPTLQIHDVLLVDQLTYRLHDPRPEEIAVFAPPPDPGPSPQADLHGADFIKRVIGVPGDTLRISQGIVYRNGTALAQPYENQPPNYDLEIAHYDIIVDGHPLDRRLPGVPTRDHWQAPNRVPPGYFFMLGDNRNYSDDSHVWGFAARSNFDGRAFFVLWPPSRFSILR